MKAIIKSELLQCCEQKTLKKLAASFDLVIRSNASHVTLCQAIMDKRGIKVEGDILPTMTLAELKAANDFLGHSRSGSKSELLGRLLPAKVAKQQALSKAKNQPQQKSHKGTSVLSKLGAETKQPGKRQKPMVEQHKKNLEKQLWNIANALRGNMSADEFRDYILGFIFYKYLSEKIHRYADEILKGDGLKFDALDEASKQGQDLLEAIKEEAIDQLGYFLKPSELFHVIAEKGGNGEFIIESLTEVLRHIEQSTMGSASEDDFNGLFDDIDLTSNKLGKTETAKNALISKVLGHLDTIDFCLSDTEIDVLGDAYEYMIGQFASGAGKKAGEFYTPQMVSKLLAKLVTRGKDRLKSVYDPTCGSGSLLLRIAREVEVGEFYGQESNPSTYNLARMNMILHDVHYSQFDIQQDDTLEEPHHIEKRFEAVVANPPFSATWSANVNFLTDERFSEYGKLAPASKADFAFVQHMFFQLDENGTMAVVLPHGALFRSPENHIRKFLIDRYNCLDAVIGLPENIFFGTEIATCILVLKKNRESLHDILFIDGSECFEKNSGQNIITDENINQLMSAVSLRKNIPRFSYVAGIDEVRENDYILYIPRYVDTFVEGAKIDVSVVAEDFDRLVSREKGVDKKILKMAKVLGVKAPGGNNG